MAKKRITKTYGGANVSIGEAFALFISERALEGIVEDTIKNYIKSLRYYLKDCELNEDSPIESISKESFMKWISVMKEQGKKHTTINHYLRDLRTFAYWCMAENREYITPEYKIKEVSGQEPAPKAFKKDLIEILLAKPKKSDTFGEWRTWAMVNWVLATGNRALHYSSFAEH